MKRILIVMLALVLVFNYSFAQDEQEQPKDKPVSEAFSSGYLIDNQTTFIQYPKTLEMSIHHKFGTLENGKTDVWGVYNSANIRLALDYVIIENLQVGYGLTRTDMVHDFNVKYTILQQTRKNTIPVSLGVYGNLGISGVPEEQLGLESNFGDRMSMFGQVMIGRKFNDRITLQAAASFSHFNMADTSKFDYDRVGLHLAGRIKLTTQGSFIFNYDQPLKVLQLSNHEDVDLHPNISFGWEIATATHTFQIYCGYSKEILPQYYMMRERKEFAFDQFNIGFTITRMWNF